MQAKHSKLLMFLKTMVSVNLSCKIVTLKYSEAGYWNEP